MKWLSRLASLAQTGWARGGLVLALVGLYVGWSGYVVARNKPVDFNLYYVAAYGFAHGYDIYGADEALWTRVGAEAGMTHYAPPYRYPPLAAFVVWPLTFFPPRVAAVLWLAATAAAFILSAWLLGRLSPSPWGIPLGLALLLGFVPALTTLHAGQINGLVLLCLTLALWGLVRGQPALAGAGVAASALLKLVPLAHLGYLGWRRRWAALGWGLLALGLLLGLSLALIGWAGLQSYFRHFLELGEAGNLLPMGPNQALNGFWSRVLLGHVAPALIRRLSLGSVGVLILATIGLCWPRGDATRLVPLEFALVTVAINLITPYAWYHQFVLLLLPLFILTDHALQVPAHRWWLLLLGVGYLATDVHGLLWHQLEPYPLLVSMPFYVALLLWGLLAWLLWREKWGARQGDAVAA